MRSRCRAEQSPDNPSPRRVLRSRRARCPRSPDNAPVRPLPPPPHQGTDSGAGFPAPPRAITSAELCKRPSTSSSQPARPNFAVISWCDELDAMRQFSPSAITGRQRRAAPGSAFDFAFHRDDDPLPGTMTHSSPRGRPEFVPRSPAHRAITHANERFSLSSAVMGHPASVRTWPRHDCKSASLSISTPSHRKSPVPAAAAGPAGRQRLPRSFLGSRSSRSAIPSSPGWRPGSGR